MKKILTFLLILSCFTLASCKSKDTTKRIDQPTDELVAEFKLDAVASGVSIVEVNKSKKEYLPNVIVLLKDQKIITRFHKCDDGMFAKHPLKYFDGFIVEECGENVLAEFIVLLFVMLRSIELKAMDIEEFSKKVHKLVFTNNKKSIEFLTLKEVENYIIEHNLYSEKEE